MIKYCENVHHTARSLVLYAAMAGAGIRTQLSSDVASDRGPVEGSFPVREQEEGYSEIWDENEQTEGAVYRAHFSGGAGNVSFIRMLCTPFSPCVIY